MLFSTKNRIITTILLLIVLTACTSDDNGATTNSDLVPFVNIINAGLDEGDSGITNVSVQIILSASASSVIEVPYEIRESVADNKATLDVDFSPESITGTVTFNIFDTVVYIEIPIIGDTDVEANEVFEIEIKDPIGNASLGIAPIAKIIIQNDD